VPQALAVGAAVERGLERRAGGEELTPVCTIMVGRLDDWLKVEANKEHVLIDPGYFEWAGVAVLKRAYGIYRERGYRTRMLSAAFRNHLHWSEFVGGDLVISPPFDWQQRINENPFDAAPRMDIPVAEEIVKTLHARLADFRRAYDVDGMTQAEFDDFAPTRRTLRQFLAANNELEALVRDVIVPNPD
jgi:transaldolase